MRVLDRVEYVVKTPDGIVTTDNYDEAFEWAALYAPARADTWDICHRIERRIIEREIRFDNYALSHEEMRIEAVRIHNELVMRGR